MKTGLSLFVPVLAVLLVGPVGLYAQAPLGTAFTYQGRLTDGGSPANGDYDFTFSLYDAETDGRLVGATIPVNGVPVVNGLFTVELDFGEVFRGDAMWLEIEVSPFKRDAYTRLSPRQELTPTPYAVYATTAGSVVGGISGSGSTNRVAKFTAARTIASSTIYDNGSNVGVGTTAPLSRLHIEDNTPDNVTLMLHNQNDTGSERLFFGISTGSDAAMTVWGSSHATTPGKWRFSNNKTSGHFDWVTNGAIRMTLTHGGDLGIGTTSPSQKLSVDGVVESMAGGFKFPDGTIQTTAGGGGASLWQQSGSNIFYDTGNVGIGTTSPTAPVHAVRSTTGAAVMGSNSASSGTGVYGFASYYSGICYGVRGESDGVGGVGVKGSADAGSGTTIGVQGMTVSPDGRAIEGTNLQGGWAGYFAGPVYVSGNLGVGTQTPSTKLDVNGTAKMTGFQLATSPTAGYVLTCDASGVGTWQEAPTGSGGGSFDLPYEGTINAHDEAAFSVTNTAPGTGGDVGTNTVAGWFQSNALGGAAVEAHSIGGMGRSVYAVADGSVGTAVHAVSNGSNGTAVYGSTNSAQATIRANQSGTGDLFEGRKAGSTVFRVKHDGTTVTSVLQITGGSDLAEQFDVGGDAEPGMVVMIDPDKPGRLCPSRGAYNRLVAGVISGANGVDAGMVLSNLPGENNTHPVALSGRVWVRCDAGARAIEPGDMLTTAPVPGHAMAVTDFDRAHGAVFGKAMSRLEKGERGLVLALVNLQ